MLVLEEVMISSSSLAVTLANCRNGQEETQACVCATVCEHYIQESTCDGVAHSLCVYTREHKDDIQTTHRGVATLSNAHAVKPL